MQGRNPFEPPLTPVADSGPMDGAEAPTQRPASIDLAFRLIIASAVLGALGFLIRGRFEATLLVTFSLAVVVAFACLIRSGKNWGRIVYLIFFLLGLASFFISQEFIARKGVLSFVIFCMQAVLQGYAAWLAFSAPGSQWFRRRRRT